MKNSTLLRRKRLFLCVSLFMLFLSGYSQQKQNWIKARNGEEIGFYEYVPANYSANPTLKYPVIIFLHGHGERGDGRTQLHNILLSGTPPRLIADGNPMTFTWNGKTESFIVISPQLNSQYGWWPNWYVDELLAYVSRTYRVDPDRVFLTGLSMGGGGTWQYAGASLENAKKFAAIGVCCGACTNIDRCNLANANLPIWAFHAKDDNSAAPYSCTAGTIDAINACKPAVVPYFTTWPDGNHYIWGRVYDPGYNWQNPNLYEWFLAQNRSLPVNKRPVVVAPDITTTSALATATLDASQSTDADGKILRYVWKQVSGASTKLAVNVSLDGKAAITGLVNEGTYVYEVKVIDDRADWTIKNITVTVVAGAPGTKKPVANAGADFTVFYPNTTTQLNGKDSYDADGTITNWNWSQVSGPTNVGWVNNNSSAPTANNLTLGTYVFKLVVTDNNGLTAEDQVTVTVSPDNIKPVAKAGTDIRITLPVNNTTLDGTQSYDSDGTLKAYEWSYVSGPSQYSITDPTAVKTTVTNLVAGIYEFKIRVWDNWYHSTNDTVKIFVEKEPAQANRAPVANAGSNREITLPDNSTSLDGSRSSDPDNNISRYEWTKTSGPAAFSFANSAAATTTVSGLTEGTYEFKLTVTDAGGLSSSATVQVKVNPKPNQPPVASAGADRNITLPADATTLDGSASKDNDGSISKYEWTYVSGPATYTLENAGAATATLSKLGEGSYVFKLTVTDNGGLSASDQVTVIVNPVLKPNNQAPSANAGSNSTVTLPANGNLDGSGSKDSDGSISSWLWEWVSGPSSYTITNKNSATTSLTGLAVGNYVFRLTVTDNGGLTASSTVSVTVNPVPNKAPVADAGSSMTITLPVNSVSLDGKLSSDPEGKPLTYEWSYLSGPTPYSFSTSAKAVKTTVTGLAEGTYVFQLLVTDEGGLTSKATVSVIVKPVVIPPNKLPRANAGADFSVYFPNVIQLNGSASSDEDGTIRVWEWKRISGPGSVSMTSAADKSTSVLNAAVGVHQFELTVTDDKGGIGKASIKVTVQVAPNKLPKASAGADTTIYVPANAAILDGRSSGDPDGVITAVKWRQLDGPRSALLTDVSSVITEATALIAGNYTFELQVTDNRGGVDKDTILVAVVNNFKYTEEFALYPNPTRGELKLRCISDTEGDAIATIFDANGKAVRRVQVPRSQSVVIQTISVSDLEPGIYFIDLNINNRKRMISKFVKL